MVKEILICIPKSLFGDDEPGSLEPEQQHFIVCCVLNVLVQNPFRHISDTRIVFVNENRVYTYLTLRSEDQEFANTLTESGVGIFTHGVVGPVPNVSQTRLQEGFNLYCPTAHIIKSPKAKSA